MRKRPVVVGVVVSLLSCAPHLFAQSNSQQPSAEGPQFNLTPYLWASGINGQLGIGRGTADFDASFRDVLEHLHFAAMGVAEMKWNGFIAMADSFYSDVRGQRATPGPLFSSVNPQQKIFVFTPEGGFRIVDTGATSIDAVGGIRLWHLNTQLQFQPGALPGVTMQDSRTWFDGIVGVRAKQSLGHNWRATAYGDVGGGGSRSTFQIVAAANWDFQNHYELLLGYRYLNVDYNQDVLLLDTNLRGPVFGITFKF